MVDTSSSYDDSRGYGMRWAVGRSAPCFTITSMWPFGVGTGSCSLAAPIVLPGFGLPWEPPSTSVCRDVEIMGTTFGTLLGAQKENALRQS